MFCTRCGKEISENANFCKFCGNPVRKNKSGLLERAIEHDQAALAEIYSQSSPTVYKVIMVLVKNRDTADDIMQDTYVKAFNKLDQLQDESKLVPWLKTIATNTAKDWLKKSKPELFSDFSRDEDSEGFSFEESIRDERVEMNPEMTVDEKEVRRLVMEILNQLPEDQRMVVGMYYYEEMSVKDIAATLGVSDNTVKSRLSYGRKKIKELVLELEKKGTKLYSAAPFMFFLYLLRRLEKIPADMPEADILQGVMEICTKQVQTSRFTGTDNAAGSVTKTAEKAAPKLTTKAAGKTVRTSARTAASHLSRKTAAIILAGAVGAGGVTYGVVKNADKLPFIHSQTVEREENSVADKIIGGQKEEPENTPDLIPSVTAAPNVETEKNSEQIPENVQTEKSSGQIPQNVKADGVYGENVHWFLTDDGVLKVNGTGAIADVNNGDPNSVPWSAYRDQIKTIVIGDGITRIGKDTFSGYGYVSEIIMADTVTEIGEGAFSGVEPRTSDPGIDRTVTFSRSLEKIGDYSFFASNITSVELPDSVKEIGDYAFRKCYNLKSIRIGENSKLESVGCQAFGDSPLDSGTIYIPSTIQVLKSDAFMTGDFADTVVFSDKLQELGLQAFGCGSTGADTVYFTGDAPIITDERIAVCEDTVFPDTTAMVYYPEGNATWDGFDFSKLGKNITVQAYDPSALKENAITGDIDISKEADQKSDSSDAVDFTNSEQEAYKAFYEKYITDEQLQVITDDSVMDYDYSNGYMQDMLLGAYMEDFGGDGKQELLLIRTKGKEKEADELVEGEPKSRRIIYLELYGIDETEVIFRQALEIPESNLNDSAAYITEQIGIEKKEEFSYLYCYQMGHASAGGGIAYDTVIKVTDNEFTPECSLEYTLMPSNVYAEWGWCYVNGDDVHTADQEADIRYINEVLRPYGMAANEELADPGILNFHRNERFDDGLRYEDTFGVYNCFESPKQTESDETSETENVTVEDGLYYTHLYPSEGVKDNSEIGTVKVEYDDTSVTFYASFYKDGSVDNFIKYGKKTFELTPETQYFATELNTSTDQNDYFYYTQSEFLSSISQLNGLGLNIEVENGKVVYMRLSS